MVISLTPAGSRSKKSTSHSHKTKLPSCTAVFLMVRPCQTPFISGLVHRLELATSRLLPTSSSSIPLTRCHRLCYHYHHLGYLFVEGNGIEKRLDSLRGLCRDKLGGIIPLLSLPHDIGFSSVCAADVRSYSSLPYTCPNRPHRQGTATGMPKCHLLCPFKRQVCCWEDMTRGHPRPDPSRLLSTSTIYSAGEMNRRLKKGKKCER